MVIQIACLAILSCGIEKLKASMVRGEVVSVSLVSGGVL
jgi:hypothetical protein